PEVGDPDKPRFVFFFDEAHLLFEDAPKALLDKVEQVVRLIRSKGVGVYFVTQNPLDIPDDVLGQLGNRIQHALRAFTARDQKAVRAAASTMRANPAFDAEQAITELAVGEALVSLLDEKGRPNVVERVWMMAPGSRMGPIDDAERAALMKHSVVAGVYDETVDRESAHEMLLARAKERAAAEAEAAGRAAGGEGVLGSLGGILGGGARSGGRARRTDSILEAAAKSAARSLGTGLGREILRGVLGTIFKGRRQRGGQAVQGSSLARRPGSPQRETGMDLGIKGRRAIVCGASRGLGFGCALSLAREGVDLVINGRRPDVLADAAKRIADETGVDVVAVPCDITTPEGRAEVLAAAPQVDIL